MWCGVTSEKVYGPFFFEEETVHAVNYLDMRPYHIQRMHALTQLNYEARLNFVMMMCERHQGLDQWLKRQMFTDEATFHVSGRVNTHVSYELERARLALKRRCGAE